MWYNIRNRNKGVTLEELSKAETTAEIAETKSEERESSIVVTDGAGEAVEVVEREDATKTDEDKANETVEKDDAPQKPKDTSKSRKNRRITALVAKAKEKDEENKSLQAEIARLKAEKAKDLLDENEEGYEEKLLEIDKLSEVEDDDKSDISERDVAIELLFEDGKAIDDKFVELVTAKDLVISDDLLDEILQSDESEKVALYIAKDKKLSKELSGLSRREMARAILRIEDTLTSAVDVTSTQQLKPITPVSGVGTRGRDIEDRDNTFEEHEALLFQGQKSKAGGFL